MLTPFSIRPSPTPGPTPKPTINSVPKPGLFGNRSAMYRGVPTKKVILELKKGLVIPGTGGQMYKKQQFDKLLKETFSYKKVKTQLKEQEVKNLLRSLRRDAFKNPAKANELNRQRRTFEGKFEKMGLKLRGKY